MKAMLRTGRFSIWAVCAQTFIHKTPHLVFGVDVVLGLVTVEVTGVVIAMPMAPVLLFHAPIFFMVH